MSRPSTRAKGDSFEREVGRRLRRELRAGRFGTGLLVPSLIAKPKFYSRDRQSDIEFDHAIEMRLDPSQSSFMTIVIECKDYAGTIPVDDIEEFKAKLDQCFGKNVKGMFVTTAALQSGALNYAKAQGICVARIIDHDTIEMMAACLSGGKEAFRQAVEDMTEEKAAAAEEAILDYGYLALDCTFGMFDIFIVDGPYQFAGLGDALIEMSRRGALTSALSRSSSECPEL